ncbi:MAG: GSU2403 family nucleotidyltransferase fold protein [Desulfobacteraceae bacterium]|nr:GSU2403 family nucleotidyltransferase fold protein [Desulfobacteraceae bacterium]
MEEKYELLSTVFKELQGNSVLDGLVIVGSWCQYFYRLLFDNAPEIPLLRTLDIDFLVPNPSKFKSNVDVSQLLNRLGFDSDFDYSTGLVKYVHPDLEIQFLTPASGRAKETPYEIMQLNIIAEGLAYMKMLQDHKFSMVHKGLTVWLPEPEAYTLHKVLISIKRKNPVVAECLWWN